MKLLAVLLAFFVMGSAATAQNTRTLHEENMVATPDAADEVLIYHGAGCAGKLICKTSFSAAFASFGIPVGSINIGTASSTGKTTLGIGVAPNVGNGEHLLTATGYHAFFANTISDGTLESTGYGWGVAGNCTNCTQLSLFGINVLGSCTADCFHDVFQGTDACRNCNNQNSDLVGIGDKAFLNSGDSTSICLGDSCMQGKDDLSGRGSSNNCMGWEGMQMLSETTPFGNNCMGTSALTACQGCTANDVFGDQAGIGILNALGDDCVGFHCLHDDAGNGVNSGFGYEAALHINGGNFNFCGGPGSCPTLITGSHDLLLGYAEDVAASSTSNFIGIGTGNGHIISSTGTGTPSTSVTTIAGVLNAAGVYQQNGTAGVNCTGSPTSSFVSAGGIVTHC